MRRHFFANHVKKYVDACRPHEFEVLTHTFQGVVKTVFRAQVILKRAVLLVQSKHTLGVAYHCLEFSAVANNPRILDQLINVWLDEIGNLVNIKVVKRLLCPRPLAIDNLLGHAALEDRFTHYFQVIIQ